MAHLEMCFIFLFKILSDTITQDVVEVRHIKLRKVGLLRIQEVDPSDETSTYLSLSGPVKDLPTKPHSIEGAERVSFVESSREVLIKSNMSFTYTDRWRVSLPTSL